MLMLPAWLVAVIALAAAVSPVVQVASGIAEITTTVVTQVDKTQARAPAQRALVVKAPPVIMAPRTPLKVYPQGQGHLAVR